MVLITLMMGTVLGMGAVSIDMATWYQHHHQAQVAADAASLAAANCLAHGGSAGDTCTSTTDTTDAINVATTIAADNGVTIQSSDVTIGGGVVTVTTPNPAPILFAAFTGPHTSTQTAHSKASFTQTTSNACSPSAQTAGHCYAIFAMDQTCSDKSLDITGGTSTINGGSHTNGSFYFTGGVYTFDGPVSYGNGTNCVYNKTGGTTNYNDGNPFNEAAITSWPVNYATDFPACTGAACTGPLSTPPYCTYASTSDYNINSTPANGVYCAIGHGTASNPATWTGNINVSGGGPGSATVTFIGGNVSTTGGGPFTFTPFLQNLYAYATTGSANFTGGTFTWTGDVFAPSGTVNATGGTNSGTTMLEGNQVDMTGGNFTGDGPLASGVSSTTTGNDFLLQ